MPELPEVETVRRGLAAELVGRRALGACARTSRLRWDLPRDWAALAGRTVSELSRRGKYLIIGFALREPGAENTGTRGAILQASPAPSAARAALGHSRLENSLPEHVEAERPGSEHPGSAHHRPVPPQPRTAVSAGEPLPFPLPPPGAGRGALILHLGMSGRLSLVPAGTPPGRHDHWDLALDDGRVLRLRDPRRFGAVLWTEGEPLDHPLLAGLGLEPLDPAFDAAWLYRATRGRAVGIKEFLMNARLLVGVGNIYANEALFRAGVRPDAPAGRLGRARCARLVEAVRQTLEDAIAAGGSSLRDFAAVDGRPGYFQTRTDVYGRAGLPCRRCATPLLIARRGGRATVYCGRCQR